MRQTARPAGVQPGLTVLCRPTIRRVAKAGLPTVQAAAEAIKAPALASSGSAIVSRPAVMRHHPFVQDAHDIDSVGRQAIEDMVGTGTLAPVPGTDRIARRLPQGFGRRGDDGRLDHPQIRRRLIVAPPLRAIGPDVVEVGTRQRRKDIEAHPPGSRALLAAMKRSKSNGVDAPLFSPAIKAACSACSRDSCSSSSLSPARTTSLVEL
jgi:hypothetical protein